MQMERENSMNPFSGSEWNPDHDPKEDVRPQDKEEILLITHEMFWDLLMEQQEQM